MKSKFYQSPLWWWNGSSRGIDHAEDVSDNFFRNIDRAIAAMVFASIAVWCWRNFV